MSVDSYYILQILIGTWKQVVLYDIQAILMANLLSGSRKKNEQIHRLRAFQHWCSATLWANAELNTYSRKVVIHFHAGSSEDLPCRVEQSSLTQQGDPGRAE